MAGLMMEWTLTAVDMKKANGPTDMQQLFLL